MILERKTTLDKLVDMQQDGKRFKEKLLNCDKIMLKCISYIIPESRCLLQVKVEAVRQ